MRRVYVDEVLLYLVLGVILHVFAQIWVLKTSRWLKKSKGMGPE